VRKIEIGTWTVTTLPIVTPFHNDAWVGTKVTACIGADPQTIFIADGSMIIKLDLARNMVSTVAGEFNQSVVHLGRPASLNVTGGMAFTASGDLLVTEPEDNSVLLLRLVSRFPASSPGSPRQPIEPTPPVPPPPPEGEITSPRR
jgi:hypothetical protein